MSKRAGLLAAGFLTLCSPLFGQRPGSDLFNLEKSRRSEKALSSALAPNFFALDNPVLFPLTPASPLVNGGFLSASTALDWMMPMDVVSAPYPRTRQSAPASAPAERNLADHLGNLLPNIDYATAEVGFMYGRSTGKFGGDYKLGYVIGEVGDDKVHISVGAAYEDSNLRFPRFGR